MMKTKAQLKLVAAILLLVSGVQAAPISDATLAHEYAYLNAKYFDGKLPGDVAVFYAPIARNGEWGDTGTRDGVLCITIDPMNDKDPKERTDTLLHEMVHIATLGKALDVHGVPFQTEMKRLAQAGAFEERW